jgi:hypothetical protein
MALVMLGDAVVGRAELPLAEWPGLRAAAGNDRHADGMLSVHHVDGLPMVEELTFGGLTEEDDEADDDEDG